MNHDPLERWLKKADTAAPMPAMPGDLAVRVRRLRARRRKTRAACSLVAFVLGVAMGSMYAWRPVTPTGEPAPRLAEQPPTAMPSATDDAARPRQSQSRIMSPGEEADMMQEVVGRMLAVQQRDARTLALRRKLADLQATDPWQERMEQAAKKLLAAADRLEYDLHNRQAAMDVYRSVIRQFPKTPSADIAETRLAQFQTTTGKSGEPL